MFDDVYFQNDCGSDRVCISGISCRLPQARNMSEFRENLQNGADMVTTGDQMVNENNGNSGHIMKTHQENNHVCLMYTHLNPTFI